jgi:hypothetical protein
MRRILLLALIPLALGIWYYMTATDYPVEVVYHGGGLYTVGNEYPLAPAPQFKPAVLHNYSLAVLDFWYVKYVYRGNLTALDISPCRPQYVEYEKCLVDSHGYVYCCGDLTAVFTRMYTPGSYPAPAVGVDAPLYVYSSACGPWALRREVVLPPWVSSDAPLPQPLYAFIFTTAAREHTGSYVRLMGPPPRALEVNGRWYILLPGRYVLWCPRGS